MNDPSPVHFRPLSLLLLTCAWAVLPACKPPAPAAPEQGDAHDHEHDHGHEEHGDEVVLTPDAAARLGMATATKRQLNATLSAVARVAWNQEQIAHVGVQLDGRVTDIKVRVGDPVKKGDILFMLQSPSLGEAQSDFLQKRTAVTLARATADLAKPAIDLARTAHQRAQRLLEERQGITVTEVERRLMDLRTAEAALAAAEIDVSRAQAELAAAQRRLKLVGLDDATIEVLATGGQVETTFPVRAPMDGRVIERNITLGEPAGPASESLLVIADLSSLWVLADVPEASLPRLSLGTQAQVTLPALGDSPLTGTVAYLSPELDAATRTARVRIEVPNPDSRLLPGMFATARFTAPTAETPVLAVADEAVQTVDGSPAVFVPVPNESNTFAPRPLRVGKSVNGFTPVLAGLKEGDAYVAAGSFLLKAELGKSSAQHEH